MDAAKTGKLIRELRTEKGLTQQELASLLKVSATAVSKWENGRGLPDISMLEPLARVFNVTFAEIILGERAVYEAAETEAGMNNARESGGAVKTPAEDKTEPAGAAGTLAEDKAEAAIKSVIDGAIGRKQQRARFGTVMMAVMMLILAAMFFALAVWRQKQNTPTLDISRLKSVSWTSPSLEEGVLTIAGTVYVPYSYMEDPAFDNLMKGLGVDDPAKLGKVIAYSNRSPYGWYYYCTLEGADDWLLMFRDDGKGGIPNAVNATYLYCTQESLEQVPDWVRHLFDRE